MIKQQATTETLKQLQFPLWKRMTLVTALLLSAGPLTVMALTQPAYASASSPHKHTPKQPVEQNVVNIVITCSPGKGGNGGKAIEKSTGAVGGNGGNCTVTIPIKVLLTQKNNIEHANTVVGAGTVIHASAVLHK